MCICFFTRNMSFIIFKYRGVACLLHSPDTRKRLQGYRWCAYLNTASNDKLMTALLFNAALNRREFTVASRNINDWMPDKTNASASFSGGIEYPRQANQISAEGYFRRKRAVSIATVPLHYRLTKLKFNKAPPFRLIVSITQGETIQSISDLLYLPLDTLRLSQRIAGWLGDPRSGNEIKYRGNSFANLEKEPCKSAFDRNSYQYRVSDVLLDVLDLLPLFPAQKKVSNKRYTLDFDFDTGAPVSRSPGALNTA